MVTARLTPLPLAEWSEQQRQVMSGNLALADRYLSGDPGAPRIPPILGLLARHPDLGSRWLAFGAALIEDASIASRERELIILRVSLRTDNQYLWSEHLRIGTAAGLTRVEIDALSVGPASEAWSDPDRVLLMATDELVDNHVVSDGTWHRLAANFDERQLLEVLFVIGSYACLAMVLNSVGLQPAGEED